MDLKQMKNYPPTRVLIRTATTPGEYSAVFFKG